MAMRVSPATVSLMTAAKQAESTAPFAWSRRMKQVEELAGEVLCGLGLFPAVPALCN